MSHPVQHAPTLPVSGLVSHKTYTLRRSTVLAGLTWLTLSTAISGAAGWYVVSKDDLAARLITRETTRQYAYEDRIAALRADVDRLASRALLNQDGVEARVDELATRQAELESRQSLVAQLTDSLQSSGLINLPKPALRSREIRPQEPVRASGVTSFAPILPDKPMPAPDSPALRGGPDKQAGNWTGSESDTPVPPAKRMDLSLTRLDAAIGRTTQTQLATLQQVDRALSETQKRLRGALSETGLDTAKLNGRRQPADTAMGGPFVPFKIDPSAGPFEATLTSLQPRIAETTRLQGLSEALPVGRPMAKEIEFTSNFGYRVDPFTRGPAMHTGADFRAETGTPIYATGAGKVITAEYSGGYGNLVEIDHGNGLITRFAHMSAIVATDGQTVQAGTLIGRVGTTGRSTGPHLHYETRMHDEPLDPARFLRAGEKLAAIR